MLTHQLSVEMQLTGGSITSPVTGTGLVMDLWVVLVPNVPQTTNNVSSPGTDGLMLALGLTPPVRTSQIKSSPSTPPADSTTNSSSKLIEICGAWVTKISTQVSNVTIWMIGLPVI